MDTGTIWTLLLMAALLALSAGFSATEAAYSGLSRAELKTMEEGGNRRAGLALRLADRQEQILAAALVGNVFASVGAASLGAMLAVRHLGDIGALVSALVVGTAVILLCAATPKIRAAADPDRFAVSLAPFARALTILFAPAAFLLSRLRGALAPKSREDDPHKAAQDELLLLVDEAEQDGGLAKEDGELLRSAIEFTDLCADDILTHRTDLEAVPDTATKEEVARVFSESRYSRILVYSGDIDSIVGVIHQKDFYVGIGVTDKTLAQIMTKPLFVANSAKISDLLKLLQRQKAHIAVVTDEYGGTLGIVTMEDILEELVGDIWDEHDEVVESIHKVGEDAYQVLGTADLEDLFEFLCIRDEETESSTVSGWVMERLGRVPHSGESFRYEGWLLTAAKADPRRVCEVEVRRLPAEQTLVV